MLQALSIDPEFRAIIPPLSPEERDGLEADIVRGGRARDSLVVWGGTLLDGHNRYAICVKHKLPYTTVDVEPWVKSRSDAVVWICQTSLHRRNLGPCTRGALVTRIEVEVAAQAAQRQGGRPRAEEKKPPQNSSEVLPAGKAPSAPASAPDTRSQRETRSKAAAAAGMSHPTYTAAKVINAKAVPELRAAVDRGDVAVSTGAELTALSPEKQREVAASPAAAKAAVKAIREEKAERKHEEVAKAKLAQVQAAPMRAKLRKQDAFDFLEGLEFDSADLLLTDPPYSTDVDNVAEFARRWVPLAMSRVKPTGRAFICTGAYPVELHAYLAVLLTLAGWTVGNVLVWTYRNTMGPSPRLDYKNNWQAIFHIRGSMAPDISCPTLVEQFSVQDINAPDGRLGDRFHAWQKPDELADRLVRHASTPGQLVVDPFAGTGSFLLAAARLGRRAIGCELSEDTVGIAIGRGCEREG